MSYLGIEIGGTKLQIGLGPGNGTLDALWRATVDVAAGPEGIRRQILAAVPELLSRTGYARSAVRGVGIGFGGPVDDASRTIIKSHQIAGWDDFPLAAWIEDLLDWPAVLGNDADVAGLAETLFGAGRGCNPVFYITVGSGIGGGYILDSLIQRGTGRGAAEIGHLRMPIASPDGMALVTLESVASGWGIEAEARRRTGSAALTVRELAALAQRGDETAHQLLDRAWTALAEGICHVLALLCPQRIVIGGGVSLLGEELFFNPLRCKVAERVFKPFAGRYEIVPAGLGEEVVVHGALALARQQFGVRSP